MRHSADSITTDAELRPPLPNILIDVEPPENSTATEALPEPVMALVRPEVELQRPANVLNRNFVLLWVGQAVSQLGSQVNVIAMVFWVKHATNSASLIASMLMGSSILNIMLSGVGGAFADRHSRRKIIICSDLLRGIMVISLAGWLYHAPQATNIILLWFMGVTFCMSATGAFFVPAISASIPDLTPQTGIRKANSLRQTTAQMALFIGQGLGGMLFRLWGAPLLVFINGLSFLFAAGCESFIRIPQKIPDRNGGRKERFSAFKEDIAEGFAYVWKKPGLRRLFFFSAIFNFFTMPVIVLLPFYVEDFLKVRMDWYGYLVVAFGVGVLTGSLSTGFIKLAGKTRGRLMIVFATINSLNVGLLGIVPDVKVALTLAYLIGALGSFNGINVATILQMSTPSEIRGRAFGLLHTLSGSIAPIGLGLGGFMYDLLNRDITLIYGGCGVVMVLLSLLVSTSREFREFLAYEPQSEGEPSEADERDIKRVSAQTSNC